MNTRDIRLEPSLRVLEVAGFIDSHTAGEFEQAVRRAVGGKATRLVVDLHGVDYMNSTGIGTLLSCREHVEKEGGRMALARVSRDVGFIMKTMGVVALFPVFATVREAVSYLEASEGVGAPKPPPAVFESRSVAPTPGAHPASKPDDASAIIILPVRDHFAEILARRLRTPRGQCRIVKTCEEAAKLLGGRPPELVVLEARADGADRFLSELKVERGGALVSVVKLYPNGATVGPEGSFKVWEDDYLVQPYEMMALFILAENKMRETPALRREGKREVHVNFESSREQHERIVSLFGALLPQAGFFAEEATAFLAAFREAVDNGIRHGNRYQDNLRMDVRCTLSGGLLSVRVEDQGPGFDFEPFLRAGQAAKADEAARERREDGGRGGLGIMLMCRCADAVRYEKPGSVVTLEKKLPKDAGTARP